MTISDPTTALCPPVPGIRGRTLTEPDGDGMVTVSVLGREVEAKVAGVPPEAGAVVCVIQIGDTWWCIDDSDDDGYYPSAVMVPLTPIGAVKPATSAIRWLLDGNRKIARYVVGMASGPSTDGMIDVVLPDGSGVAQQLPVLWRGEAAEIEAAGPVLVLARDGAVMEVVGGGPRLDLTLVLVLTAPVRPLSDSTYNDTSPVWSYEIDLIGEGGEVTPTGTAPYPSPVGVFHRQIEVFSGDAAVAAAVAVFAGSDLVQMLMIAPDEFSVEILADYERCIVIYDGSDTASASVAAQVADYYEHDDADDDDCRLVSMSYDDTFTAQAMAALAGYKNAFTWIHNGGYPLPPNQAYGATIMGTFGVTVDLGTIADPLVSDWNYAVLTASLGVIKEDWDL